MYVAHWDHLGQDESLDDDQIFNGAADNATGTAGMIELARAFSQAPEPPRRSILFLAVTAEEQGLLGRSITERIAVSGGADGRSVQYRRSQPVGQNPRYDHCRDGAIRA